MSAWYLRGKRVFKKRGDWITNGAEGRESRESVARDAEASTPELTTRELAIMIALILTAAGLVLLGAWWMGWI